MRITSKQLFIWSGAQFYLDWLLPSNNSSKNILFKGLRKYFSIYGVDGKKVYQRLRWAGAAGRIHLFGILLGANDVLRHFSWYSFSLLVFGNVYPCIVQLYIGYRCLKVKAGRYRNKKAFLERRAELKIQYPIKSGDKIHEKSSFSTIL